MTFTTIETSAKSLFLFLFIIYGGIGFGQTTPIAPQKVSAHRPSSTPEEICGFTRIHNKKLQQPAYRAKQEAIENLLYEKAVQLGKERQKGKAEGKTGSAEKALDILTIPIVIHIIHLSSEPNPGDGPSNPTDAQILAGIAHLNDAYRNVGVYAPNGHSTHPATFSVDVEIEFCLAQRDINGNPTTGILRYASDTYSNLNLDQEDPQMQEWVAAQDSGVYPGTDYAHVWLVNEICKDSGTPNIPNPCNIAGYAYFPGGHGDVNNGVVNLASYWGASTNSSKVHIHEFGHYLNLYHTFQGGCTNNNCLTDGDRVCDTPPDNSTTYTTCGEPANSCTTDANDTSTNNPFQSDQDDLYENYMDYSASTCQNTFTQGQKDRMRVALLGARGSLLNSQACAPTEGVEAGLEAILFPGQSLCDLEFAPTVIIKSNGSEAINSLLFGLTLDGVTQNEVSWTGNIPPDQTAQINLSALVLSSGSGDHELTIEILESNGAPDLFTNNNLKTRSFRYADPLSTLPYCEDLENGALNSDWVIHNPDNSIGFEPVALQSCDQNGNYALGLQTWGEFPGVSTVEELFTQSIDLTNFSSANLNFAVAYAVYYSNFNTILDVSISTDCGLNFTSVYHKTGNALATASRPASSASDPAAFFIPENCSEWKTETISLDPYSGQAILIRFQASTADLTGSSFGYYWGNNLYLDNLCLTGTPILCGDAELVLNESPIVSGVYDNAQTIFSGGTLENGAEVTYEAAESITLLPGFQASNGTHFLATIGPCTNALQTEETGHVPNSVAANGSGLSQSFEQNELDLEIAPNPLMDQAIIRYFVPEGHSEARLLLLDVNGQKLQEIRLPWIAAGWQQHQLSSDGLPAGMYYLLLTTDQQWLSKKMVVMKD